MRSQWEKGSSAKRPHVFRPKWRCDVSLPLSLSGFLRASSYHSERYPLNGLAFDESEIYYQQFLYITYALFLFIFALIILRTAKSTRMILFPITCYDYRI